MSTANMVDQAVAPTASGAADAGDAVAAMGQAGAQSAAGTGIGVNGGPVDAIGGAVSALGQTESLFSWGSYFQALAFLFLIVAVLFAVLWLLKRKGGIKLLTGQGNLVVETRMTLGPKKSLLVVRFLNKRLLLGVTDQRITMLTELPLDEDDPSHHKLSEEEPSGFTAHLVTAEKKASSDPG